MKDFFTRALSAFVFVAIMAAGLLWNQWSFALLMLLVLVGSLVEYYKISLDIRLILSPFSKIKSRNFVTGISVVFFLIAFFLNGGLRDFISGNGLIAKLLNALLSRKFTFADMALLFPVMMMFVFIHELFSKAEMPFMNIGWNLVAMVFITMPVVMTIQIYFEMNKWVLFALIGLVWIYDAMAYCCGMLFGKHKLVERLSPKKTVEGLAGGLLLTAVAAYLFKLLPIAELQVFSSTQWIVLSVVIALAATCGDLAESMLKRCLGVKDSGFIMPGHGGFLDRFDAFFVAIPFAAFTIWVMQQVSYVVTLIQYLG